MNTSTLFSTLGLATLLAALCSAPASAAPGPVDPQFDRIADEIIGSVRIAITAGNCDAAVNLLKSGLKSGRPKVSLLA